MRYALFALRLTLIAVAFAAGLTCPVHRAYVPRPCTFDGGGMIASGDAARTDDGHVWACADGQLYRIDRPAS